MGKITLYIEEPLLRWIKELAKQEKRSLTKQVEVILEEEKNTKRKVTK